MGKYDALRDHLRDVPGNQVRMTFEQVGALVPGGLPPSAYRYPAWWANETDGGHVHARSWLGAGWRVTELDLGRRAVTFVRAGSAG